MIKACVLNTLQSIFKYAKHSAEASEANKIRTKISDAVKRQSEQIVVAFLNAAASNDRAAVDRILDEGSIEVDDSDGTIPAVVSWIWCTVCCFIAWLSCQTTCRFQSNCTTSCCYKWSS
jgi:hypothetical protein